MHVLHGHPMHRMSRVFDHHLLGDRIHAHRHVFADVIVPRVLAVMGDGATRLGLHCAAEAQPSTGCQPGIRGSRLR